MDTLRKGPFHNLCLVQLDAWCYLVWYRPAWWYLTPLKKLTARMQLIGLQILPRSLSANSIFIEHWMLGIIIIMVGWSSPLPPTPSPSIPVQSTRGPLCYKAMWLTRRLLHKPLTLSNICFWLSQECAELRYSDSRVRLAHKCYDSLSHSLWWWWNGML